MNNFPQWVEYAKLAAEVIGPLAGAYLGTVKMAFALGRRLGKQDALLYRTAVESSYQSKTLEGMAQKSGSQAPPRPQFDTLNDLSELDEPLTNWKGIEREAHRLDDRRGKR